MSVNYKVKRILIEQALNNAVEEAVRRQRRAVAAITVQFEKEVAAAHAAYDEAMQDIAKKESPKP